jgi:hypothetical protein
MAWNVPRNPYMNKILFLLVTIATNQVASAQLVSIGVKGGVPFLDTNQGGVNRAPISSDHPSKFACPPVSPLKLMPSIGASGIRSGSTSPALVPV